jgi:peptidoglycan hydrolase-like protein with peptidoglycan-binding domain
MPVRFIHASPAHRRLPAAILCSAALVLSTSILFVAPPTARAAGVPFQPQNWSVEQFQPPIKPGGRANTIAVHPNDSLILVASESGGLFRSNDGGKTWHHVEDLPLFYTNAVAFAKDPKFVIVTASEDFSAANHGGIWRSEDGGGTWTQVLWPDPKNPSGKLPHPPSPSGVTERFSAYEISVAPDTGKIYVASNYGVLIGDPSGKDWSEPKDPFADLIGPPTTYDRAVRAVTVLPVTTQACGGTQGGNLVLAGGRSGVRWSPDGADHWCVPKQSTGCNPDLNQKKAAGCIMDMHAFGRSPIAKEQAWVVTPSVKDQDIFMKLYYTPDGGNTWNEVHTAEEPSTQAGGIAFVKAIKAVKASGQCDLAADPFHCVDLYFSTRGYISKLPYGNLGSDGGPAWVSNFIFWGSVFHPKWPKTSDVGDTRDIAFDSKDEPILVASDNGLAKPSGLPKPPSVADIQMMLKNLGDYSGSITGSVDDETQNALMKYQGDHKLNATGTIDQPTIDSLGSLWTFAGGNGQGNGPNGYHALQLYEVKGQWVGGSRHDLYFGTQDNNLWSSSDTGKSWNAAGNEGGFIEGQYRIATPDDAQTTCYAAGNLRLKGLLFLDGVSDWPNPPGPLSGSPKIIWKNFHVQGADSHELQMMNPFGQLVKLWQKKGLAVTYNLGASWKQYATIDEDRKDLPRLSVTPKKGIPILYQVTRKGFDATAKTQNHGLARIVRKKNAEDASVSYPTMNNFGEFGAPPTMAPWWEYRVFAVHPRNANHLIAPDIKYGNMKETTDGGDSWTEMPQLTSLVTNGGQLNFSGNVFINGINTGAVSPQASAISFCPDNPDMVAVGTVQNGIFISTEGGKDGTWTKVPGSEQATLISSLHWRKPDDLIVSTYGRGLWRVRLNFTMPIIYFQKPPGERPSPYDQVAVAYGGGIEGARVTDGILQEIFVEPSTTIAFAVDSQQMPDIKVTETTRPVGFQGVTRMPRPPKDARIITGLTLKKRGTRSEFVGFLFSPRPRSMYTPEERGEAEEKPVGRTQSPTAGKPYLEVLTGSVTVPNGTIQVAGRNLRAEGSVEIAFDGTTVQRLVADRAGKFAATVQAPSEFGIHTLTLIDSATGRVLNGAMVSVRPEDGPRAR